MGYEPFLQSCSAELKVFFFLFFFFFLYSLSLYFLGMVDYWTPVGLSWKTKKKKKKKKKKKRHNPPDRQKKTQCDITTRKTQPIQGGPLGIELTKGYPYSSETIYKRSLPPPCLLVYFPDV